VRLVFDGSLENRTIRLTDIVSVEAWSDAMEVASEKRAKNLILNVGNPLIWAALIQQFAQANARST
jgi:hypothetical protein